MGGGPTHPGRPWEGDPHIQTGLWKMEGRVSFWGLGVDQLDAVFDGQGCDAFGNILEGDRRGEADSV